MVKVHIKDLLAIEELYSFRILLLVAMFAFGCHIDALYKMVLLRYSNISLVWNFESFEEFLLQTNMFNKEPVVTQCFSNLPQYANSEVSWETFFEKFIKEVSENKLYKYYHCCKLYRCYYEN